MITANQANERVADNFAAKRDELIHEVENWCETFIAPKIEAEIKAHRFEYEHLFITRNYTEEFIRTVAGFLSSLGFDVEKENKHQYTVMTIKWGKQPTDQAA